ncbi:hypothetical protein GQ457_02G029900 [Hibiscus cannabinus]
MTLELTTDVMVRESESLVVVENNRVEKYVPEKMYYAALVAGIGKSTIRVFPLPVISTWLLRRLIMLCTGMVFTRASDFRKECINVLIMGCTRLLLSVCLVGILVTRLYFRDLSRGVDLLPLVWIRLPGLSYRYYTKSLFKLIAAVIGQVVRVDYNTLEGERGKFARLAVMCGMYGHVKDVCGIPKEPERSRPDKQDIGVDMADKTCVGGERSATYGPWMVVTHHRGNYQRAPTVVRNKHMSGSRFSVLDGGDDEVVPIEVENMSVTERGHPDNAVGNVVVDVTLIAEPDSLLEVVPIEVENTVVTERGKADQVGNASGSGREGNPDNAVGIAAVDETLGAEPDSLLEVVGGGSKVPVVLLNGSHEMHTEQVQVLPKVSRPAKGTHTSIVIRDKENMGSDGSDTGRKSGGPIRTTKIAPRQGITLRKHGQNKGGLTSVLSEWIPATVANIDRVAQEVVQHKSDNEWLGDIGPLASHVVSREWLASKDFVVRDMVTLDGEWNWNALNPTLPITIRLRIAATKPPCVDGSDDFPVWRPNRNRNFTVRSAYDLNSLHVTDNSHPVWRVISAFRGWPKVRMLMWLACHERLL